MVFAVAFPSLPDPTEKERDAMNGGWRVESTASAAARPNERTEMVALVKEIVITVDDGGCAWMAPTVPPIASSVAMMAEYAAAEDF